MNNPNEIISKDDETESEICMLRVSNTKLKDDNKILKNNNEMLRSKLYLFYISLIIITILHYSLFGYILLR